MNLYLVIAASLTVIVALIHSLLGEKLIIIPVLRLNLPPILESDFLTKRTLRFAWHLMTVAALGFAALLFYYSTQPVTPVLSQSSRIIAAVFAISGIISAVVAHGRHFSWWAFLLISGLIWLGAA